MTLHNEDHDRIKRTERQQLVLFYQLNGPPQGTTQPLSLLRVECIWTNKMLVTLFKIKCQNRAAHKEGKVRGSLYDSKLERSYDGDECLQSVSSHETCRGSRYKM